MENDEENESMEQPLLSENDNKNTKDVEKGMEMSTEDIVADSNYNDVDNDKKKKNVQDNDENDEKLPSKRVQKISNVYFHLVMTLAACYMAMLFSNWGTGTELKTTGTINVSFMFWTK